jgi:hypothetical protein
MEEQRPGYGDSRAVKKLRLPGGLLVGINDLDIILREVAELKLTDNRSIKKELLDRVKTCNYVPSGAEYEYSVALLQEYQRKFGGSDAVKDSIRSQPPGG